MRINEISDESKKEKSEKAGTLRETKSMRSSALALKGLELEEMLRQSSLSVEGV